MARERHSFWGSESVFLSVAGACSAIFRRSDVETIAQGKVDRARVVVLGLAEDHAFEVERAVSDALVEEVVGGEFDVESSFEEVFADAEGEHGIGGFIPEVRSCIAMCVHVEVGL